MSESRSVSSSTSTPLEAERAAVRFGEALAASAALHGLRLRKGRKPRVAAVAALLVLAAAAASAFGAEGSDVDLFASVLDHGLLSLLAPLLGFLFGAGMFAEEMEEGTFLFQAIRPAPRGALALGRALASAAFALTIWSLAVLGLHLLARAGDPEAWLLELPATARAMGGGALLVLWLMSVSALLGIWLPEAAGVSAGLYLLLVETGGTWIPGVLRLAVPAYHGRMLAGASPHNFFSGMETPIAERMLPPAVDWYVSAAWLLLLTVLAWGAAVWSLALSEVRPGRS